MVEPGERSAISGISNTQNHLLVNMLVNVKSELYQYSFDGSWKKEKVDAPDLGTISLGAADEFSDSYFFYFENFLEPSTLYHGNAQTGKFAAVKSLPSWFETTPFKVEQMEAVSKDGTRIPFL